MPVESQHRSFVTKKGFTLIEVLIAVAIASVLMMIGIPIYQNYEIRTKISGEFVLMHPLMLKMNEEYALTGQWPSSNAEAGAQEPAHYKGKYLKSVTVSDSPQAGTMILTYDADELTVLRGTDTLIFRPTDGANSSKWQCDQGTIPSKYRPSSCL